MFVPCVYCSTLTSEKMKAQGAPWIHMHPSEARRSSVARAGSVFARSNSCDLHPTRAPQPQPCPQLTQPMAPARYDQATPTARDNAPLHHTCPHDCFPSQSMRQPRLSLATPPSVAAHTRCTPVPLRGYDPCWGRYTVSPHGNPVPSESCDGRRGLPP